MWLRRILVVLTLSLLTLAPAKVSAQTVGDVAKQLICQCGCTALLDNCAHQECMVREQMLSLIQTKTDKGQPEAEIVAFFVDQYGEKVLASPPKRGFNLAAWITPFVAILAGAAIIYAVTKKWARRGKAMEAEAIADIESPNNAMYEQRLERELKDFTMRGFR